MDDRIVLRDVFTFLWKRRIFIVVMLLVGLLGSLAYTGYGARKGGDEKELPYNVDEIELLTREKHDELKSRIEQDASLSEDARGVLLAKLENIPVLSEAEREKLVLVYEQRIADCEALLESAPFSAHDSINDLYTLNVPAVERGILFESSEDALSAAGRLYGEPGFSELIAQHYPDADPLVVKAALTVLVPQSAENYVILTFFCFDGDASAARAFLDAVQASAWDGAQGVAHEDQYDIDVNKPADHIAELQVKYKDQNEKLTENITNYKNKIKVLKTGYDKVSDTQTNSVTLASLVRPALKNAVLFGAAFVALAVAIALIQLFYGGKFHAVEQLAGRIRCIADCDGPEAAAGAVAAAALTSREPIRKLSVCFAGLGPERVATFSQQVQADAECELALIDGSLKGITHARMLQGSDAAVFVLGTDDVKLSELMREAEVIQDSGVHLLGAVVLENHKR